jgi:hypothetical protein
LFDVFFYPFRSVDSIYGLCAISLLTSIIALPIFKYTSNQEGIKRVKARIMGHLLELRLYKDDIRVVISAQINILKYNMVYLRYTLKPLMFMIIPISIIIIYTASRYEYRPLQPGESTLVKINLSKDKKLSGKNNEVALSVPLGLSLETPPLRIDGGNEIYWRIRVEKEGVYDLVFQENNNKVKRKLFVTSGITRLSPETFKGGIINAFLNPGEPSITGSTIIESIEVKYPSSKTIIFGWNIHWLVIFFVLTLVFGFMLMKPFKVRI